MKEIKTKKIIAVVLRRINIKVMPLLMRLPLKCVQRGHEVHRA